MGTKQALAAIILCVPIACGSRGATSSSPSAASASGERPPAVEQPPRSTARQLDATRIARDAFSMVRSLERRQDDRTCKTFYDLPDDWTLVAPMLSRAFPRHAASLNVHLFRYAHFDSAARSADWALLIEARFAWIDSSDTPRTVDEDRERLEAAGVVEVVREKRDSWSPPRSFRLVHERPELEIFVLRSVAEVVDEGRVGVIYDEAAMLLPLHGVDAKAVIDDPLVRDLSALPATSAFRLDRQSIPLRDYPKEAERVHDIVWRFSGASEALLLDHIDGLERFVSPAAVEQSNPYFRKLTPTRPGVLVRRDPDDLDWEYENPRATVTVYSDPIQLRCK